MTIAIAITPASGSVVAVVSACRVDVTGAVANDPSTFDADNVPTEDPIRYRLVATKAGQDDLVSHEFTVSSAGKHTWDNVIFPDDGTWSIALINQDDDSSDATLSVTVTA